MRVSCGADLEQSQTQFLPPRTGATSLRRAWP